MKTRKRKSPAGSEQCAAIARTTNARCLHPVAGGEKLCRQHLTVERSWFGAGTVIPAEAVDCVAYGRVAEEAELEPLASSIGHDICYFAEDTGTWWTLRSPFVKFTKIPPKALVEQRPEPIFPRLDPTMRKLADRVYTLQNEGVEQSNKYPPSGVSIWLYLEQMLDALRMLWTRDGTGFYTGGKLQLGYDHLRQHGREGNISTLQKFGTEKRNAWYMQEVWGPKIDALYTMINSEPLTKESESWMGLLSVLMDLTSKDVEWDRLAERWMRAGQAALPGWVPEGTPAVEKLRQELTSQFEQLRVAEATAERVRLGAAQDAARVLADAVADAAAKASRAAAEEARTARRLAEVAKSGALDESDLESWWLEAEKEHPRGTIPMTAEAMFVCGQGDRHDVYARNDPRELGERLLRYQVQDGNWILQK